MSSVNWQAVQTAMHSLGTLMAQVNPRAANDIHEVANMITDIPKFMAVDHYCEVCEDKLKVVQYLCPSGYHYKVGLRQVLKCENPECPEDIVVR